jgi:Tfp pilus assembly protein PilV
MPLKPEARRPKADPLRSRDSAARRNPKPETRREQPSVVQPADGSHLLRISDFGFRRSRRAHAFSLIEIMVTVGLLSFIILGLLLMFNQTQRAFRSGLTQTDVLEAGRATMDLLTREMEQMSPSEAPDYIENFTGVRRRATNFFVEPSTTSFGYNSTAPFSWVKPLVQELPGNAQSRTNLIQRFFFLSKLNQDWIGTGYEVVPDDANQCVGTLYRYTATNYPRGFLLPLSAQFLQTSVSNRSRIADGIVHLRLRAYAANGRLITTNSMTGTNASYQVTLGGPYTNVPNTVAYNSAAYSSPVDLRQASCYFMSNAVPAYLELELGLLEPQILQKYRSIGLQAPALQYLSNRVAHVHIFRQRIPVRNVDLSAYP